MKILVTGTISALHKATHGKRRGLFRAGSLSANLSKPQEFSHFLPGAVQIFARTGVRNLPATSSHPERSLDSKRPGLLPLNLSQPETRLAAHLIGVILSPRIEVIQHFPAGGDPLKDFVPKERDLTDESIQSHSCSLANNVSLTLHA